MLRHSSTSSHFTLSLRVREYFQKFASVDAVVPVFIRYLHDLKENGPLKRVPLFYTTKPVGMMENYTLCLFKDVFAAVLIV